MAGRKRTKKLAAALLPLLLGGFIYTTTGARADHRTPVIPRTPVAPLTTPLAPTVTPDAPVAPLSAGADDRFDGVVATPIRVTCAPGATTGTGEVKLKVIDGEGFHTGDTIPTVNVTWNGGSTQIKKYNTWFTVSNASLPCPTQRAALATVPPAVLNVPFTFHFPTGNHNEIAQLILNLQISINLGL
jgi:hypothetical protein